MVGWAPGRGTVSGCFISQTCPSSPEMPRLGHPTLSSLADKALTARLSRLSVCLSSRQALGSILSEQVSSLLRLQFPV